MDFISWGTGSGLNLRIPSKLKLEENQKVASLPGYKSPTRLSPLCQASAAVPRVRSKSSWSLMSIGVTARHVCARLPPGDATSPALRSLAPHPVSDLHAHLARSRLCRRKTGDTTAQAVEQRFIFSPVLISFLPTYYVDLAVFVHAECSRTSSAESETLAPEQSSGKRRSHE